MNEDVEVLAKVISSLQPTTDYMKDYIFPGSLAFISALMGGVVAMRINRHQELMKMAKDNFSASNNTFVLAHECLNHLVSTKANYLDITFDEPLYRAIRYPLMVQKNIEVKFSATSLYFVRAAPTANKPFIESIKWHIKHKLLKLEIKTPPQEELAHSWRNTVRVSAMFDNYNLIHECLRIRNELYEQIREPLSKIDTSELQSFEELTPILGKRLCGALVDITETIIALTDHVIKELHLFLLEFPAIAESNIELKRIREWGRLPTYQNMKPRFLECLKPLAKPDYKRLAAYVGISEEEAIQRYTYSDWV